MEKIQFSFKNILTLFLTTRQKFLPNDMEILVKIVYRRV